MGEGPPHLLDQVVQMKENGIEHNNHFDLGYGPVLYDQPSSSSVSILIGKMPAMRMNAYSFGRDDSVRQLQFPGRLVETAIYLYLEAGKARMPGFAQYVDGRLPVSEKMPVIYYAHPFIPSAPIVKEHGLSEGISILVPQTHLLIK